MLRIGFIVATLIVWPNCTVAQPVTPPPGPPVTVEEVVKLSQAGVAEDVIVTKIKRAGRNFDLTTDEILELRKRGLSDTLIKFLMDPSQPYTPPPPPAKSSPSATAAAALRKPLDPIARKVPPEPGVYYSADIEGENFTRLELKPVFVKKSGGGMSAVLTAGIKKDSATGYLKGSVSRTKVSGDTAIFFVRLPEKAAIDDIVLLALSSKGDERTIDLGPKPDKPVFPPDAVKQYQSSEIDTGLFRLSAGPFAAGEYLFLQLGSGEEKKGILGKGWEFSAAGNGKESKK